MLWLPLKISRLNWHQECQVFEPRAVGRKAHRKFLLVFGAAMPPLLLRFLQPETHAGNLLRVGRGRRR